MALYATIVGPRPQPYPTIREPVWPAPGPMPRPRIMLLIVDDGGCAMVHGYAADGTFAGDNWYETMDDAVAACRRQYDVRGWQRVEQSFDDAVLAWLRKAGEPE